MIAAAPAAPRVRFHWILDRRSDLVSYIGSALAGWAYVAVILYAWATLVDPFRDPLATVTLFGATVPLTLNLLVMVSWAFILDAPHVWATLGRTLLDPGESGLRPQASGIACSVMLQVSSHRAEMRRRRVRIDSKHNLAVFVYTPGPRTFLAHSAAPCKLRVIPTIG
jgi:hypothetical protein